MVLMRRQADRVDAHLHQLLAKSGIQHLAFFGTWVLNQTVEVMLHFVLSGLELELYLPYEYRYIFWYMAENLYSWVATTLTRADTMLEEAWQAEGSGAKGGKKSNKKKGKRAHSHELRITRAQAMQHVCSAFYKVSFAKLKSLLLFTGSKVKVMYICVCVFVCGDRWLRV